MPDKLASGCGLFKPPEEKSEFVPLIVFIDSNYRYQSKNFKLQKMFTEEQKNEIFQKCRTIDGMNSNIWRLDSSGAIIRRTSYGRDDELYGWEIDHVIPVAILDKYHVPEEMKNNCTNLRAMNWNNNVSKGDSYPGYDIVITSEDEGRSNTFVNDRRTVNTRLQERLRALYAEYVNFDEL